MWVAIVVNFGLLRKEPALVEVPLPQTIAFYGQSSDFRWLWHMVKRSVLEIQSQGNKLCAENLLSKSVNGDQHTPITSARLEQDGRLACIPEHAAALRNGSGVLATYAGTSETVHNSMRQFCLLASVVANGAQCWSALTRAAAAKIITVQFHNGAQ